MSSATEETFETESIGLVAYLRLNGHEPMKLDWIGTTCRWYFAFEDDLVRLADAFRRPETEVPVQRYNKLFMRTKQEFYDSKNRL